MEEFIANFFYKIGINAWLRVECAKSSRRKIIFHYYLICSHMNKVMFTINMFKVMFCKH